MTSITPTARRRGARSRLGGAPTGLPTALPPAEAVGPPRQLALPIAHAEREPAAREVLHGAVHVPGWLDLDAQRAIVDEFRRWARPPAGLRHPRVPTGHLMSVQSVCLGWHWRPYAYSRTADDTDGAPVKPLPTTLVDLARAAVAVTFGAEAGASYAPDAVIANLYTADAR